MLFDKYELNWIFERDYFFETFEPVKLMCESLCRCDATLLSADRIISFMLDNLGSSDLAK